MKEEELKLVDYLKFERFRIKERKMLNLEIRISQCQFGIGVLDSEKKVAFLKHEKVLYKELEDWIDIKHLDFIVTFVQKGFYDLLIKTLKDNDYRINKVRNLGY